MYPPPRPNSGGKLNRLNSRQNKTKKLKDSRRFRRVELLGVRIPRYADGAGGGVCTMLPRPEIVFDLGLAA
jgi:hypothetical protein